MDLIEDLEDEVEEEELNQEWLEENADELEESMVYLMLDQEDVDSDLEATKAMLQAQLDSQKSYLESLKLKSSEVTEVVSSEEGEFN